MEVVYLLLLLVTVSTSLHTVQGQVIQFVQAPYFQTFEEEQPVGTSVLLVGAGAFDSFGDTLSGVFSIPTSGDAQFFTIETTGLDASGTNNAILRSSVIFDWDSEDAQRQYTFPVTFSAATGSRSEQVTVSIVDINDNSPSYTMDIYEVSIFEGLPGGSNILNTTALDPDQVLFQEEIVDLGGGVQTTVGKYTVSNGRVSYSITGGNELGHFEMNSENGTLSITTGVSLDVDLVSFYNFTVMAVDGGGKNDTAEVLINVLDSNDNAPRILSPRAVDVTISEDTPLGYVIVEEINVTDADSGFNNGVVDFFIVGGDQAGSFNIDQVTGQISVGGMLDRELQGVLNLSVVARDRGFPEPLQDLIYVVVRLLDVNDFTPRFTQDSFRVSIRENSRINSSVARIEATDLDQDENGTIAYSILDEGEKIFFIDAATGELFTNSSLNREEVAMYSLIVEAVDSPQNASYQLSSQVNVTIDILDDNDNDPIFAQESYEVSILDNVTRREPLIQLVATDRDSGSNGLINYRIQVPDPIRPMAFRIDADTGMVYRNGRLRFEEQNRFTFSIRALDNGPFTLSNDVPLVIILHDVNVNSPIFDASFYNATLIETTPINQVVLNVSATDDDVGPIGMVRYRIVTDFDSAGSFEVDETTGEIRVNSTLDFDFSDSVSFVVEAFDGGFPLPFTDRVNVTISLIGTNDEAPTISFPAGFQISVPENTPPIVDVVTLRDFTFDPDVDQGGEFFFSLSQIYDPFSINDSFSLNETTGLISSLRVFDRELQPEGIVITIETIDFEGLSQETNITVMIGDMNDNSPYFNESSISAAVHEFLPPGEEFLSEFRALDADIGSNADLRYSLFSGVGHEMFSINSTTGALTTAAVLNKTVQREYNLTVMVMDRGNPPLFGFGTILVEVLDSNDMTPIFSQSVYSVSFLESDPVGTLFLQVNASDSDIGTNANLLYSIASSNETDDVVGRFTIDEITGDILTRDVFDRERETSFVFTVIAVDSGLVPHPLTGSATILVTIIDVNEHPPRFNSSSYEATVIENADNGTFVAAVYALDEDADPPNNVVVYSLRGNRSEVFSVDPDTGMITVTGEVDWEEGGYFSIVVVASDSGFPLSLSNEVELFVTVVDINDQPPVFIPESLTLTIAENTSPGVGFDGGGVVVGFVMATDEDSTGNNSATSFSVLMDFTNGKFTLDPISGLVLFVRGTLNRERRAFYNMLIRVEDNGSPDPLHTDATLTINILDSNDFDPVFDQDLYTGSVAEREEVGMVILSVRATDEDVGTNAQLLYSIAADPAVSIPFEVNETTGEVYIAEMLDFETVNFYSFVVVVSDSDELRPRNSTTLVEISVEDSNDLSPVFTQSEYSAVVRENLASGTTLVQISADDSDTYPENTRIEFSFLEGEGSEMIGIDPETGVVYTNAYLNREDRASYNLTVIANNSQSPYPLQSYIQLFITLTDLNDMHPSFDPVIDVSIFENISVSSVVYTLNAQDGDEGVNGTIEYALLQSNDFFSLDPNTGELTLLQPVDHESSPRLFLLPVLASDSGNVSLSNYTNVLVQVEDSNDNPPVFGNQRYSVSVDSESPVGTSVLGLRVRDEDEGDNAVINLSFLSGNEQNLFDISGDGVVTTTGSLISYVDQVFVLTVEARDAMFRNEANVSIYIQGGEVSLPRFNSRTYMVALSETANNGDIVMEFSSETLNEVSFFVNSEIFSISSSGTLTVSNSSLLDFESRPFHQITVVIENSGGDRAYAVLTIEMEDQNEFPPEFIAESFIVGVPETTGVGVVFFTAIAVDEDGAAPANQIMYDISLTDSFTISRFRINSATGELSLTRSLQFESGDREFNVTIRASDSLFSPVYSTTARLEIQVLNGNSFDPVFDESLYTVRLLEDHTVGVSILNVSATDRDEGSSGDLTFGLHGDHQYLDFRIDTFTGEIFTNSELDYERSTFYTLEVVASDGGNPGRQVSIPVELFIQDLNDNTPIWNRDLYSVNILEDTAIESIIIEVLATDIDQVDSALGDDGELIFYNRNGYVTYSITAGDATNNFDIDPDTGEVSIASSLDREIFPEYNLTLNATDGGGLYSNSYLQIVVHDVNDKVPLFLENPYSVGLSEDALNGTQVVTLRAIDTDLNRNSEVLYFFEDATFQGFDISGTFFLNSTTGDVTLESAIDREDISFYNLTIIAVDMGEDVQLTGTTQVLVNVLDINEFPPAFTRPEFSGDIDENEPIGTPVLQINTTDEDFGENSTVFYSIAAEEGVDVFVIDTESGVISVVGSIDFESINVYQFTVTATDTGPLTERLTSTTNVTITILDVNDNSPFFLETAYITSIPEDSIAGDLVLNVNASDLDSGSNSDLVFALEFQSDEEAGMTFDIDSRTGVLTLSDSSALDRERRSRYDITVNVSDRGIPSLMSSVSVTINIADVNDNTPLFVLPLFQGTVFENSPSLTNVANVSASDEDVGSNADIRYSITRIVQSSLQCVSGDTVECTSLLDGGAVADDAVLETAFSINSITGDISTLSPLDRENVSSYVLEVMATDLGEIIRLNSTAVVIIEVLDRNDETPRFSQNVYFVNISEFSSSGELVTAGIEAFDADISTNAEISYSLSSSDLFTVNSLNGDLFTMSDTFDREAIDTYTLTVMATDRGMPSRTGSALVVVAILDENDSPPSFSNSLYTVNVRENLPPRHFLLQLNGSDADEGLNSELIYSILSSSPDLNFAINSSTGALTTTESLDREAIDLYILTILAQDRGNPSLNETTQVNVVVDDENDFPPSFLDTPYEISIDENTLPEEGFLLKVSTSDLDIGSNSVAYYSIVDVTPMDGDAFEINQTSGELFLRLPLDAEVSEVYNVTIRADNGDTSPFLASEEVVFVLVGDLNDNAPRFEQVDYIIPYSESNPIGSKVIEITAVDSDATDQNSILSFEITGGYNTTLFNITTVSGIGVVCVAGILDRESEPVHVLELSVFDNGSPQLNTTTTLTVNILDFNDNTPIFEQSAYSFNLVENSPVSTLIGRIRANDFDLQNISYFLNDTELFEIDSVTGEITTAFLLDREEQVLHSIIAVASDGGETPRERSAEVTVNITILDINDVSPLFSNSTYYVDLYENTSISSQVLTVEAMDADFAENGTVFYSISYGNDSSFFSINFTSGSIFLERELDRESQDLLEIVVMATDLGTTSLSGSALVMVRVLDNNDNIPVFSSPRYTAVVPEDTPIGTSLVFVSASDLDIDQNSNISYSLSDTSAGTFEIGEMDGVITSLKGLDFESVQNYSFFVVARDSGAQVLSSTSEVFIEVVDLNDNSPQFSSDTYQVSVPENSILGTQIFQIPAMDSDSTSNGELRYSILYGNFRSAFLVNEVSGQILVSDYLDREITSSYLLGLRAVDQGEPQFTATTELVVSITDINDHSPMFGSKIYSVSVPESSPVGTSIFQFVASDLDIGRNANLSYSIESGNQDGFFEMDSNSGDLTISRELDAEMISSYALSVLVSDGGSPDPLVDTALIRIYIGDHNEYPPTYPQALYHVNISQNTVVGSPIGHFVATDRDLTSRGSLEYRLIDGMVHFEVDRIEGSLYVIRSLPPGVFMLSLEVTDGDYVTAIDIHVTVIPLMVALTMPLFDASTYLFEVSEAVEPGSIIGEVSPSNARIFTAGAQELFTILPNGSVVVVGDLDSETSAAHVLNIAIAQGTGSSSVYVVMTISVLDANDNAPVFESEDYRISISESILPGSTIGMLQAYDTDSPGINSEFRISLASTGNEAGLFQVDPSTGILSVTNTLDYEINSSHLLTAVVTNYMATPTLSSTAQIVVSLLDENDNSPEFDQTFYQISIPASTPIGTEILTLEASDPDSGTNSQLVYSITHINEPLTFTINQTSGVVMANASYNRETMTSYLISVSVADLGNPQPLESSTIIFVEVTPDNISPPEFSNPDGYSVEIPETLSVGGFVVQVQASDAMDSEGGITYTVESGDEDGNFAIGLSSGIVTLLDTLDFNLMSSYNLTIQAMDSGTPPLTTSAQVSVTVLDVNNNDPQFELRSYEVSVLENATVGTSLIQVIATDSDTFNITYQITVNYYNADGMVAFGIDSSSGEITTAASIDREMDGVIEILVSAIDSGYLIKRSNTIPVIINVLDLNDNPPVFNQSEYTVDILRLLSAGKFVATIAATDSDEVGEDLTYSITSDTSDGLFSINPINGSIETVGRVPETTNGYQLEVTAYDGAFLTSVAVLMEPVDNGDFCEDNGFCTTVKELDCIVFRFTPCDPCDAPSVFTGNRLCVSYSCIDATLSPCVAIEICQPMNMGCDSTCPVGTSLCSTTNLCHVTTLSESCDGSNITCLVGQSLVQRNDTTRYCTATDSLPQMCDDDSVYCEGLGQCMNRSAPYLCQPCPGELLPCPDSAECVSDIAECCRPDEEYCEVLDACLLAGMRCELPNVAPTVTSDLIYLESITTFSDEVYSGNGHVISALLGNGTTPAVDSQGEEISIAITRGSEISTSSGEWQFSLSVLNTSWTRIETNQLSETNALVLPNTASVRFVRRSIVFDGAVWLRVKIWDGNTDGFISPSRDLVMSHDPGFMTTLPYTPNGAFSQSSTLLTILVHPLILPPFFDPFASLLFTDAQEDVAYSSNLGDRISDLVLSVDIPNFQVLPENRIQGFPQGTMDLEYEQQLPVEAKGRYYDDIARVNPTRIERQYALQSGQIPGVGVMLDSISTGRSGTWQVAFNNDPKLYLDLGSILTSSAGEDTLLLNVSARLRFLPDPDFCGVVSILLAPWDGVWNASYATLLPSGYIITTSPHNGGGGGGGGSDDGGSSGGDSDAGDGGSGGDGDELSSSGLSTYNLNEWVRAEININCVPDTPRVLERSVQASTIPYRIKYRYERLFTLLIDRNVTSLRRETETLSNYLQIILQHSVTLKRFSLAMGERAFVSFSVVNDALTFEEVSGLIDQRRSTLALLDIQIINISQDASYGPGAGCPGDSPDYYHGDHVASLANQIASDGDNDFLGLAVVGATSATEGEGVWQYHRGNWSTNENASSEYNRDSNIWINLPLNLSPTRALLLHGNDRIRFIPLPGYFWSDSSSSSPSIQVKVWDNSLGQFRFNSFPPDETSTMNINTDPLVDTLQSIHQPIGLFSSDIITIEAGRYGCDGVIDSGAVHDECCVCGGSGASCGGCDGVGGSNVRFDSCDICGGSSSCVGCDLIPFSDSRPGACPVCLSQVSIPTFELAGSRFTDSSFVDCNGDCRGDAFIDTCGVCSGGSSSHDFNSDRDCAGTCFGDAVVDFCGDCTGGESPLPTFNQNLDCTGVCNGPFITDSCGVCLLSTQDNNMVVENRDCSGKCFGEAMTDSCGVCYGGNANVSSPGSTLDRCGVCGGSDTSCVGCDGLVGSGKSIDRCGKCGGNNCGCFLLDSLSPTRGPTSGMTTVTLRGAGFFLNDSSLLGFEFNSDSFNCGAPTRFLSGSSIPIVCSFNILMEQIRVPGTPVDQETIVCQTYPSVTSGVFSVNVSINNAPFSNPVQYVYDDYSIIVLEEISPPDWEIDSEPTIAFVGDGFVNSSFSACLIYDSHTCFLPPSSSSSSDSYISVPAIFVSSMEVRCVLPPSSIPCQVTVRLSLDGQESGRLDSTTTDFLFTYRYSVPRVTDISFLEDLSGLSVQFDRQVETTSVGTEPSCDEIFNDETLDLIGRSLATCLWRNTRQDEVIVSLPPSARVRIESPMTFRNGALQTRNTLYSFSITNLTIFVNRVTIQPIAVIDGPSFIPNCGSVTFSGLHSRYQGYSGFEYYWSILVRDSTIPQFSEIMLYLDSLSTNASQIALNSSLFLPDTPYTITFFVVSSVGLQSESETLELFRVSEPSLQVMIIGSSERVIGFDEDLLVQSDVTTPECSQERPLQFQWELIRIVDERRGIIVREDTSSIKSGSQLLTIPTALFAENLSYQVRLQVSTIGNNVRSGNASLGVRVRSVPVVVRIHGGNRTVSSSHDLVLDARNSSYSAVLDMPSFSWSCQVVGSQDACYNQSVMESPIPVPISLPYSSFVSFPSSILSPARSYMFSLRVEQGMDSNFNFHESSVVIEVVNSTLLLPIVELSTPQSNLLLSHEIPLFGFVYSNSEIRDVRWESVPIEGQGFLDLSNQDVVGSQTNYPSFDSSALSEFSGMGFVATVSPNVINRVNLVLLPNALQPNLYYTFRLSASNSAGTSYSQITVGGDPSPTSAAITAFPTSGVALETNFELTVSGVVDTALDSPFLYQFGMVKGGRVVTEGSLVLPQDIQWVSAIQASPSFKSLFPSGYERNDFTLDVFARIFDRKGGFSDVLTQVTVHPNPSQSDSFYGNLLEQLQRDLDATKDWINALSTMTALLSETDKVSLSTSKSLKEQSLLTFLDIFENYLPPSSSNYILASSILSTISSNRSITETGLQRRLSEVSMAIAEWFKNETAVKPSFMFAPTQELGIPLYLRSPYITTERELLSVEDASVLLTPLVNLLEGDTADAQVAEVFVRSVETVGSVLCQQTSIGEERSLVNTSLASLSVTSASPQGSFSVSNHIISFGSSLSDLYQSQACGGVGVACSETCIVGASFQSDLLQSSALLQLSDETRQKIAVEIDGSDPLGVELISDIISLSISIPFQDSFLTVQNLDEPIQVLIPVPGFSRKNESLPLCFYREVGGASGFGNYDWMLDNTSSPQIMEVNSIDYYVCAFNHLSEFAIGLLPPPIITPPPTTSPPPTTPPATMTTIARTTEATSPPVTQPVAGSPVGAIVAVIIILLLVGVVVGVVILILFLWRKKKKQNMKISPESKDEDPIPAELVHAGPLTPAESKVPMDIIQCLEEGKRTRLGKMNVLPSVRLRELRYEIAENFPSFKNKPFYFLNRQLCDIDPTTEQQQFVSIVFSDKPIFIREVSAGTMLTKKHFCICGNAAQFECSNCSSQGYCSEECQGSHWKDKHQKECSRLSEKKRRTDVLYSRQSTSVPPVSLALSPISEIPHRNPMGLPSPTSPTSPTTPGDWKTFMSQKKKMPAQSSLPPWTRALSVPAQNVTSLGSLARQQSIPHGQALHKASLQAPPNFQTQTSLGPLKRIPLSGPYGAPQSLSPQPSSNYQPSLARLTSTGHPTALSPISPRGPAISRTSGRMSIQSPLQSTPQQPFFTKPPQVRLDPPAAPAQQLSIQSVGSGDFALSPQGPVSAGIRSEPFLESDEDDYSSSSDSGSSTESDGDGSSRRKSVGSPGSRPPSLAMRKKKESRVSGLSESSEEGNA